jgi:hypothetical protein
VLSLEVVMKVPVLLASLYKPARSTELSMTAEIQ